MLFSSITFLYYFLPAVIALYYLAPKCMRNSILLLSSFFFYGWGEPKYLLLMLFSIAQAYVFGLLIERYRKEKSSRVFLTASLVCSLFLLGYFKYADFFLESVRSVTGIPVKVLDIALPIGISFYTFQVISYVVDVYRGKASAQKNIVNLALYIAMFPQLIAGPIVRYTDIDKQLSSRAHTLSKLAYGVSRLVIGLSKKVLIANVLYELVQIYETGQEVTAVMSWIYAIAYTLQVYFDFSGYSDMAIGLGYIFGFELVENFNYPYISGSITEFWRRWHMSLGSWFRDYLYIPLGGNRVSKPRFYLNIFIVWLATGLWHGAAWNFVLWGLIFGVLLVIEKIVGVNKIEEKSVAGHIYVMFFIIISFVIFGAKSVGAGMTTIAGMLGMGGMEVCSQGTIYYLISYAVVLMIAIVGATPLPKIVYKSIKKSKLGARVVEVIEPIAIGMLLLECTAYIINGSFNPFLYFRF